MELNLQYYGGRGSSSGISSKGNLYGSQYNTLHVAGNVKFIEKVTRESETVMETMTKGRVYASVAGNQVVKITYFDNDNKRVKTIDLDFPHKGMLPHVHHGYLHNENDSEKGAATLTPKEKDLVEAVQKEWYNFISRK